jgi:endonuclease III
VIPAKREELFRRFQAANPEPKTELQYRSPFQLLIAVILSAQATDKSVNLATRGLFAAAPDARRMLALGLEGLESHIRTIGLYHAKARHILQTCQILLEQHRGQVPDSREALQALPGVGRKTANVVLNCAFGQPTIAVDTHIFRVSNRTGLAPGANVDQVEAKLLKAVPTAYRLHAHHWLILHGRYRCKARNPDCAGCEVQDLCGFKEKSGVSKKRKSD